MKNYTEMLRNLKKKNGKLAFWLGTVTVGILVIGAVCFLECSSIMSVILASLATLGVGGIAFLSIAKKMIDINDKIAELEIRKEIETLPEYEQELVKGLANNKSIVKITNIAKDSDLLAKDYELIKEASMSPSVSCLLDKIEENNWINQFCTIDFSKEENNIDLTTQKVKRKK